MGGNGRGNLIGLPGHGGSKATININLETLEDAVCPICGANIFDTGIIMYKKLPAIQSPNGQPQLIGIPAIACIQCSNLFLVKGTEFVALAKVPKEEKPNET